MDTDSDLKRQEIHQIHERAFLDCDYMRGDDVQIGGSVAAWQLTLYLNPIEI